MVNPATQPDWVASVPAGFVKCGNEDVRLPQEVPNALFELNTRTMASDSQATLLHASWNLPA